MALALYRKYRSATFGEVIGQDHVTAPLMQALSAGRINHAYLFSGPRGCGKTSSARILARSLNCVQGPTPTPCGVCPSCIDLAPNGSGSIDVIEIDAASHGGVDDARDLRERAYYAPVRDHYKVYIIDEAHMVTTQGFNALLKLVEEPPEFLIFIFATTEPDKVLQTIRSRTHHYPFRLIPPSVMRAHLERICEAEGAAVEPTVFPLVVRSGGGSARDSLSILDQLLAGAGDEGVTYGHAVGLLGVTDSALLDDMTDALAMGDAASVYATIDRVVEAGHDPRRFAADLLERFRDLIVLDAVPDAVEKGLIDYPADQAIRMTDQSRRLGTASLVRFADIAHTTLTDMRGTTSPRLMLELLSARMLLPDASADSAAMLQRIERLERRQGMAISTETAPEELPGRAANARTARTPDGPRADAPQDEPKPKAGAKPAQDGKPKAGAKQAQDAKPDATPNADAKPHRQAEGSAAEPNATEPGPTERLAAEPSPTEPSPAMSEPTPAAVPAGLVPTISPTVADAGSGDAASVRRVWPDVLEQVKARSRRTRALLDNASIASVDGTVIRLSATSTTIAKMISDDSNLSIVRDALSAVVGGGWQIDVAGGSAPSGRPDPSQASSRADPRPYEAQPTTERPAHDDDGVDEDSDAVHGTERAGADPEAAAIALLQNSLGARSIEA